MSPSFNVASDAILGRIKVLSNFESVHLARVFRSFTIANILRNIIWAPVAKTFVRCEVKTRKPKFPFFFNFPQVWT